MNATDKLNMDMFVKYIHSEEIGVIQTIEAQLTSDLHGGIIYLEERGYIELLSKSSIKEHRLGYFVFKVKLTELGYITWHRYKL
jgi:hypothetical protein